jgi:hypothetical protein
MAAAVHKVYFSDVFDVPPAVLDDYGAFNIALVNDLPLFIDPFLLFDSEDAKYRALHDDIIAYLCFLRDRAIAGELTEGAIAHWLLFKEVKQNWLGFSRSGNSGTGLGIDFAQSLARNLKAIFRDFGQETITAGSHLEKLGLLSGGVGRDHLSDFTTNLIKGYLLLYTQAFAREHVAAMCAEIRDDARVPCFTNARMLASTRRSTPSFTVSSLGHVLLISSARSCTSQASLRCVFVHGDQPVRHGALSPELIRGSEILVERLPADAVRPRKLGLRQATAGTFDEFRRLVGRQRLLPAFIDTLRLRDGDTLALSLPDQVALELAESSQHGHHQLRHGVSLARERQAVLHELNSHAPTREFAHGPQ